MRLNCITNPNKNLEEKINFFFDYFVFALDFIGRAPFLPLETPTSCLHKIVFQLENNSKKCTQYIQIHIQNFDFFELELFKSFDKYQKFKDACDSFREQVLENTSPNGRIKYQKISIVSDPNFLAVAKAFLAQLQSNFFDKLLKEIYTQIICNHKLRYHKKTLKHFAIIIVSEFLLKGHSKRTTQKIVQKILQSKLENVILPPNIEQENDEVKKEFLSKSTFETQFSRVKILYETVDRKFSYFIIKVNNCYPYKVEETEFEYAFKDVILYSPIHQKFSSIRSKQSEDWRNYFFKGNNHVLAVLKVYYEDEKSGQEKAINRIKYVVNFLKIQGFRNIYVDEYGYLITKDFIDASYKKPLQETIFLSVKILKNHYPIYHNHLDFSNPLLQYFLGFVDLYNIAVIENSVSKYWQYLESFFPKDENDNPQVEELTKKLLTQNRNILRKHIAWTACECLFDWAVSPSSIGWNHEEQKQFRFAADKNSKRIDTFIIRQKNNIHSSAVKEIIKDLQIEFSSTKVAHWNKYIEAIITEMREYRNADLHTSRVDPYLERKLKIITPQLVKRLKSYILELFEANPTKSVKQIFQDLE